MVKTPSWPPDKGWTRLMRLFKRALPASWSHFYMLLATHGSILFSIRFETFDPRNALERQDKGRVTFPDVAKFLVWDLRQ